MEIYECELGENKDPISLVTSIAHVFVVRSVKS